MYWRHLINYVMLKKTWNGQKNKCHKAKQRFNVGLAAQTDYLTTQASYEAAVAYYVAAKNTLNDKYEILNIITGRRITNITPLQKNFPLIRPSPLDPKAWANVAMTHNLAIQVAKIQATI